MFTYNYKLDLNQQSGDYVVTIQILFFGWVVRTMVLCEYPTVDQCAHAIAQHNKRQTLFITIFDEQWSVYKVVHGSAVIMKAIGLEQWHEWIRGQLMENGAVDIRLLHAPPKDACC